MMSRIGWRIRQLTLSLLIKRSVWQSWRGADSDGQVVVVVVVVVVVALVVVAALVVVVKGGGGGWGAVV